MRWIIYYGDGTTYCDQDGAPENAPARNVQVIAVEDVDCGQVLLQTKDYYWYRPEYGDWLAGDIFGMHDYVLEPGWKKIIFGRTIGNQEYQSILAKASESDYLPRKSARRSWERKT